MHILALNQHAHNLNENPSKHAPLIALELKNDARELRLAFKLKAAEVDDSSAAKAYIFMVHKLGYAENLPTIDQFKCMLKTNRELSFQLLDVLEHMYGRERGFDASPSMMVTALAAFSGALEDGARIRGIMMPPKKNADGMERKSVLQSITRSCTEIIRYAWEHESLRNAALHTLRLAAEQEPLGERHRQEIAETISFVSKMSPRAIVAREWELAEKTQELRNANWQAAAGRANHLSKLYRSIPIQSAREKDDIVLPKIVVAHMLRNGMVDRLKEAVMSPVRKIANLPQNPSALRLLPD